ncbi:MAG: hypothetical protein ABIA21_02000 [Candidatus Aenigmatarchaeota archaeon]
MIDIRPYNSADHFDSLIEFISGAYDALSESTGTSTHQHLNHPLYDKIDKSIAREICNIKTSSHRDFSKMKKYLFELKSSDSSYFNDLGYEIVNLFNTEQPSRRREKFDDMTPREVKEYLFKVSTSEMLYYMLILAKGKEIPLDNIDSEHNSVGDIIFNGSSKRRNMPIVHMIDTYQDSDCPSKLGRHISNGLTYIGEAHNFNRKPAISCAVIEIRKMFRHANSTNTQNASEKYATLRRFFNDNLNDFSPIVGAIVNKMIRDSSSACV